MKRSDPHMLNAIRTATHSQLPDSELANELVRSLPSDAEGALFWA